MKKKPFKKAFIRKEVILWNSIYKDKNSFILRVNLYHDNERQSIPIEAGILYIAFFAYEETEEYIHLNEYMDRATFYFDQYIKEKEKIYDKIEII